MRILVSSRCALGIRGCWNRPRPLTTRRYRVVAGVGLRWPDLKVKPRRCVLGAGR